MMLGCILIDEENRENFNSVFPDAYELTENRVAVAAVDDEKEIVVGAVSYKVVNNECVIDWLYVEPQVRRQGIGTYMIDQVLRAVVQSGDILPVTAQFEFGEDNAICSFFLSVETMETSYSHERYYLTPEDIRNSDSLHRSIKAEHKEVCFFDLSENEQKIILNLLSREKKYTVYDYDKWKEECVKELCKCIFVNNNLMDLIFMRKLSGGNLELTYLYGKYPRGLIELLESTVSKIEALFPGAELTFDAIGDESQQLAQHLFPKAKTAHIYEAEF